MTPFSIIANNCWTNKIYEGMKLPYMTPLVSIFLYADCYMKMLRDVRWYLHRPLEFMDRSKYFEGLPDYPIALIGGDVELHCLHYSSPMEVQVKWTRRLKRLVSDDSRMLYKFSNNYGCTPRHLEEFDALPFPHKVCYTSQPMPHLKSAVHLPAEGEVRFEDQTGPCAFQWVNSRLEVK